MKNLEKTIVENFMRFYPKNLDTNLLKKFLTEQDDFIRRWENEKAAMDAFRAWETTLANEGRTKLVKTNAYKDVLGDPAIVPVSFWNNFVTIDSMTNADAVKQQIDAVLEKLTQQGVNLEDPSLNIDIISRATAPPASVAPSSKENTGKKQIDHNYNGLLKFDANGNVTPESKAAFDAKQKTDPQWGNKILAQKRGDAAAEYIKSKGIKAKVTVKPEINAERREFVITAKVAGKEKYIAPLLMPDMTIKLTVKAEWIVSGVASMLKKSTALMPKFFYMIEWQTNDKVRPFGGSIKTQEDGRAGMGDTGNSSWMRKKELFTIASGKQLSYSASTGGYRNPLQANKSSNYAGTAGDKQNDAILNYLLGTGHFGGNGAYVSWNELQNGASKLSAAATGFNFASWLTSTSNALKITSDVQVEISNGYGEAFYGRELTTPEEIQQAQAAVASTKINIEKTINLRDLAAAAAAAGIGNVSAEVSTDPKFWSGAGWYDATVTPPKYGISLKENPNFFADATFSKTSINK
jgi:hypothetical protein